MNNLKKGAMICALVMMISIVPAFALNDTANNTTGDQTSTTTAENQHQYGQKNAAAGSGNCGTCDGSGDGTCTGTCDGDQHKYQYGQKNSDKGTGNCDQQHKYGQTNGNSGTGNCDGQNCENATA